MKERMISISKATDYPQRIIRDIDSDWSGLSDGDGFLVGAGITIHGSTFTVNENIDYFHEMDELVNEDKAPVLCELSGHLILAEEAVKSGYNPLIVCDNYDGDLSYTYSTLSQYGISYDLENDYERNIFYIHEIDWDNSVDIFTRNQIIKQLKSFIFELYHVRIDIVCYYLAPIKSYEQPSYLTKEKEQMMLNKIANIFYDDDEENNVIQLGDHIDYSEGSLEYYENETENEPYPKELVNKKEYKNFKDLGFIEVEESRLMVKLV